MAFRRSGLFRVSPSTPSAGRSASTKSVIVASPNNVVDAHVEHADFAIAEAVQDLVGVLCVLGRTTMGDGVAVDLEGQIGRDKAVRVPYQEPVRPDLLVVDQVAGRVDRSGPDVGFRALLPPVARRLRAETGVRTAMRSWLF